MRVGSSGYRMDNVDVVHSLQTALTAANDAIVDIMGVCAVVVVAVIVEFSFCFLYNIYT